MCVWFLPSVGGAFLRRARRPALPPRCLPGRAAWVGRVPSRPAPSGLGVVFVAFSVCCRLSRWFSACCVCFFLPFGAAFFGVGAAFLGVVRCCGCCFFAYLRLVVGSSSSAGAPFPSAVAVVRAFGWSRVFGWFALAVSRVPVSPGLSPASRVAAACPRFASWLCGHLGCSWWVGWSVASACAASLGVSVGSGGAPAPGVQLRLFS